LEVTELMHFFPVRNKFFIGCVFLLGQIHGLFGQSFIIPEPSLQQAVANSLGVAERDLTAELIEAKLIRLEANNRQIRDLSGLEIAKNLEYLVLRNNLIQDLKPIQNLSKLRKLDLHGNRLNDLSSLAPLSGKVLEKRVTQLQSTLKVNSLSENERAQTLLELSESIELLQSGNWSLRQLNLSSNRLLGLSGIVNFKFLSHLDVSQNSLIDMEGVSRLSNLVSFFAHGNQLGRIEEYVDRNRNKSYDDGEPFTDESGNGKRDIDPLIELRNLSNLEDLHLYDNHLKSINSMGELPSLKTLLLSGNQISDLKPLEKFHNLNQLSVANNRVFTLDGLQTLEKLQRLNLAENHICDLRPLRSLKSLHSLDLHSNIITDANELTNLGGLRSLGLSHNLLSDPVPILHLEFLSNLSLSHNRIPIENANLKEQLELAKKTGVYFNIREQKSILPEAEELVRSLVGYPNANRRLADHLRKNGYRSLTLYLNNEKINLEDKITSLKNWKLSLRTGTYLSDIPLR